MAGDLELSWGRREGRGAVRSAMGVQAPLGCGREWESSAVNPKFEYIYEDGYWALTGLAEPRPFRRQAI